MSLMDVHSASEPFPRRQPVAAGTEEQAQAQALPHTDVELPIHLEPPQTRRARSGSKVFGKGNPLVNGSSATMSTTTTHIHRDHVVHILVLISLNETFDKKTLTIPTYPQVLKLGRPNNVQKAPSLYNGYFDSRVISREHAELFMKEDGKVYIKDCRSANGTFVNGVKILEELELHKDDKVDLGIDIDNETNKNQLHRKISCLVEGVLTVPIDAPNDLDKILQGLSNDPKKLKKSLHDNLNPFDAAVFGDVTKDLEDVALGINHDLLSGIFVNNNIGTSSNLIQSIRLLINQLHQEKLNNMKLKSIHQFLEKYEKQLRSDRDSSSAMANISQLEKKITNYKGKIDVHSKDNAQLRDTILLQTTKLEELQRIIGDQSTQLQALSQLHSLEEKNLNLMDQVATLEANATKSRQSILDFQTQLVETNESHKEEVSNLQKTIMDQHSKYKELQQQLGIQNKQVLWKQNVMKEIYKMGMTISLVALCTSIVLKLV